MSKKKVISLFSGALGLDLGLEACGFEIVVAVENNKYAAETIKLNRPNLKLIEKDISKVTTKEILEIGNLKSGEATIVSAGPSCQSFSTAGNRGSISDPRGKLFKEFLRVVNDVKPRFFVMENVKGILSSAIIHRPLNKRGPGFPVLDPKEQLGSGFALILQSLKETGYYIIFDVLNAADYGVPQTRERVVFIGSRDGENIELPIATHAKTQTDSKKKWISLRECLKGLNDKKPEYIPLPPNLSKYMKLIPTGGNWKNLTPAKQKKAMNGALKSWGGRVGFFRRLTWTKPSPALTTHPISKATMLCHPHKLRPLSVKEYSRIQQFPDEWKFAGNTSKKYTQIGNAVPVGLGKVVGETILKGMRKKNKLKYEGFIYTTSDMIKRISSRPPTMLNPPRMRKIKSKKKEKEWLVNVKQRREIILPYLMSMDTNGKETHTYKPRKSNK